MDVKLLFGCLVLAALCNFGYPCSCFRTNVKKQYCDADFVMKVWVTSTLHDPDTDEDYDEFYTIRILGKPWKFVNKKNVDNLMRVYTPSDEAACGVYLEKGKRYLISGFVRGGQMMIDSCGSIVRRTRLPRNIKKLKSRPPNCSAISGPN